MQELLLHLIRPIVAHPDDISVQEVDGEATVLLELTVNSNDYERVEGGNGKTLRAIRNVLSAAAGKKKATVDLIDNRSQDVEQEE